MIIGLDRTKKLIIGIIIVLILLGICVGVDKADDTITVKQNNTLKDVPNGTIMINGSNVTYVGPKNSGKAISDGKIYTEAVAKTKNTITMTGKPSCSRCARNGCSYTWRTKTYVNYCPNCHRYGTLYNKHKWAARHEQEITCRHCDSDFCINCGKEKYSWSGVYLRKP